MATLKNAIVIALIFGITQSFCNLHLPAQTALCPSTRILVHAENESDIQYVCRAVTETISFLLRAGIETKEYKLEIYLVEGFEKICQQELLLGYCGSQLKEIYVLSYECCNQLFQEECFCGQRVSRELHTSFVVHEIAHALTIDYLSDKVGCVAAAEYIAYATQFSLMSEKLREQILTLIPNDGFDSETEITSLFHELNPCVFAVKAYRHFLRPENGVGFFHRLITGQCLLDKQE